jgi:hypothetical protein
MLKKSPRNIKHMAAVIFLAGLDLEQKSSFLDGHQLANIKTHMSQITKRG